MRTRPGANARASPERDARVLTIAIDAAVWLGPDKSDAAAGSAMRDTEAIH